MDTQLAWWKADTGVLPNAYRVPWTLSGLGATLLDEGVRIADTSVVTRTFFYRKLFDADGPMTRPRTGDWVWFQIRVKGMSSAPAWASGASPLTFYIDDGARAVAVSIGSTLQLIDPATGAVLVSMNASFPWLFDHVYMLVKCGPDQWALYVDGQLVQSIPYLAGAASTTSPPQAGFGSLDPVGLATGIFDQPELGLNQAVPPQWKIDRVVAGMPAPIQSRWNELSRALMRATVGMLETPLRLLEDAWRGLTASRVNDFVFAFAGNVLPGTVSPVWAELTGANLSIVRERVRIAADGLTPCGAAALFPLPTLGISNDAETMGRGTWIVREFTPDAQGRVGPYIQITDGNAVITAQLVEITAGESWGWVFTDGVVTGGAYAEVGSIVWRVDPYQANTVEIEVLGRDVVLLLVNDQIVDRIDYDDFPAPGGLGRMVELAVGGAGAGAVGVYDLEHAAARRRLCDLTRRPLLQQSAVERTIPVGGCERNDELETCTWRHNEVQQLRGTTQGMLVEMRRISCNAETAAVVRDLTYTSWFLEVTYPEITPIWLEGTGTLADIYLEFGIGSLNFSPAQLAEFAARYLVPLSTLELQYHVSLATRLTAPSTVPAPGTTRVTVASTEGFLAGDTVQIHDPTNTESEATVVQTVVSDTVMDLNETAFSPFPTASVVRKDLATT